VSYARWSEQSSVYVYLANEGLTCCACRLQPGAATIHFDSTAAIVQHLHDHEAAGHLVEPSTFVDLLEDAEQNDHFLRTGEYPE
jgi:hypothetical protein